MQCLVVCLTALFCSALGNQAVHYSHRKSSSNETKAEPRTLIYPGTKWCGPGDIATGEDDFGYNVETDKCCQQHDKCLDYIEGWGTKHGLRNPVPYTRLNCECDEKFLKCLQDVDENTSENTLVGQLYFTGLSTRCFREDFPATCRKEYLNRCVEYDFDENGAKMWQWFDEPFYNAGYAQTGQVIGQTVGQVLDNYLSA